MQEFDMTVVSKSGSKPSDADSLSRAPVESAAIGTNDDDEERFLEAVIVNNMAKL